MANQPAYDLLVLIDADAPEERRTTVLEGIRKQISGGGELKSDVEWGVRKLAFEIAHRGDAYYHLFQLEAQAELLTQLEHSLAIDDAVLRHRIIRLSKGVPDTPPPSPGPTSPRAAEPVDEQPAGTAEPPAAPAAVESAPAVSEAAAPAAAPAASESSESAETPEAPEAPESSSAAPQE
jgi:small subunit ribosomal protein S6